MSTIDAACRLLFETSQDLVFFTDEEGSIARINSAGIELLGFDSQEELVGKSIRDFYYEKNHRNYFIELLESEGKVHNFELILVRKNGEKLFCVEDAYLIRSHGPKRYEYYGIIKNITPRIESDKIYWRKNLELSAAIKSLKLHQRRLNRLLDWGKSSWWELGVESGKYRFSESRASLLGFGGEEISGYEAFLALVHPEDREALSGLFEELKAGEREEYEYTYRIKDQHNVYQRWYEVAKLSSTYESSREEKSIYGISIQVAAREEDPQFVH